MSPVQPLTTDWREWSRFMQNQGESLTSLHDALNVGPMRELLPQIGSIRPTSGITSYQTLTTNVVYAVPFLVTADFWDINGFYWIHGTSGTGNVCVGVYSEAGLRLATTGSLATANEMAATVSPAVRITRNRYYLAMVINNNTDTVAAFTGTPYGDDAPRVKSAGTMVHSIPAFPLPAQATLVSTGFIYLPAVYVGIAASTT